MIQQTAPAKKRRHRRTVLRFDRESRRAERLVRKFEDLLRRSGSQLADRFGEEAAATMREEMLDEYRRLIPEIPDIGGRHNLYSTDLTAATSFLALYRVVVRHGGSLEAAGEMIHEIVRTEVERLPRLARTLIRTYRFSRLRRRKLERAARRSQARRYPGDWVFEVVEGDGKSYDFGIDMSECGILKFFQDQGAEKLMPYLCELDYVMAQEIGIELQRTKTLAWGCDMCDFRLSREGETSVSWPPRFVERSCGDREMESETALT